MPQPNLPGIKLFDLSDRVAIVTGGSKGLGYAMADGLASAGANLVIVNRNEQEGQEAAKSIMDRHSVQAISLPTDVTSEEETQAMAQKTYEELGRIDILINNAGINIRGAIDELSADQFRKVMDINVNGVWYCTKAVTPFMKKAKRGKIINIASTLGVVGLANRTPYTSSKGAVVQMTKALSIELAPWNINVNAICPGPFLTEMNIPIAEDEATKQFILGATALGRWGELEEIQGMAIYLASDAAAYTVGSIILVDGGWVAK